MSELTWQAAAAANILEARKRNGRIGSRKSRSGCLTCKTRRIKCDETHPECRNCGSGGRKCTYADAPSPKNNNKHSRSLIGHQLSQSLGLGESDIRAFDYFLSWTAPRLAGSLDKEFWCGQVLQVAQTEPIVLDALLAISILYEHPQYMKSFYPPGDPKKSIDAKFQNRVINFTHPAISQPPIDEHHASALVHYNRAMRRFKERIDEGTATPLLALLTCALFICTEVIRDHVFGALVLFTQGTKLLSEYEPSGPNDAALYMNLRLMFARFGLHTALFGHSGRVDVPAELIKVDTENGFASILNARSSLYSITTDVQDCIRDTAGYRLGPWSAHLPRTNFIDDFPSEESYPGGARSSADGVTRMFYGCVDEETVAAPLQKERIYQPTTQVPLTAQPPPCYHPQAEMLGRQAHLRDRLGEWYTAFMKSPFNQVDDEASVNLLMQHLTFHVWLEVCLIPSESAFDQFTPQFEEILRLADVFLKLKTERTTFTLEAGVIPHLYFVATKCRVPSLRRRAVDLMHKAPFKEAMHGATSVAEFVNVMIAIEEEDLYSYPTPPGSVRTANHSPPIDDSVLPPEHKRIQILEILKNKPAGRFEIRVSRHSYDATGQRIKVVKDYPL